MRRSLTATAAVLCACSWGEPEPLDADQRQVVERNLLSGLPTPHYRVNADLDGEVTYLGLDASPDPARPGEPLTLVHYMQVQDIIFDWEMFVHVQPRKGAGLVNADHVPIHGLFPSSRWRKGQILRDEHVLQVPPGARGELQVLVGLYHGTGRIPVASGPADDQGRVVAAHIVLEEPSP